MIDQLYQFLASIGFKEPIHPPITHMPIGLATGAIIFFLLAVLFKQKQFVLTSRHVSILAFVFAFPTILLGVIDWIHFYHGVFFVPIIIKMVLATILLIVLATGIIVGSEIKLHSWTMTILYAIAFVCVIGLGYYGSGIIYGRGLEQKTKAVKSVQLKDPVKDPVKDQLGIEEKLGNYVPLNLPFVAENGMHIQLKDVIKSPTILVFVAYRCPNLCNLLLSSIATTLRAFADKPDAEPNLVTVSIDENETQANALKSKNIALETIQKPYPADKWHFLLGSHDSIKKLTDSVGFHFIKKGNDFDHPLGLIILSPEGKVVRYIMGTDFLPVDLKISLLEASSGIVKPTIARVFRFCFSYNPKGRQFVFNVLQVSAIVIFIIIGGFVLYLVISSKKRIKS